MHKTKSVASRKTKMPRSVRDIEVALERAREVLTCGRPKDRWSLRNVIRIFYGRLRKAEREAGNG
jgi:hypothetical protein